MVASVGPTVGTVIRWVSRPTTSLLSVGEGDSTANLVDVLLGILQAPATVRVGQDSSGN